MLRQIVMLVSLTLTIISFNGCCTKCPETSVVYVPQKCVIPSVDEPLIDNTRYDRSEDIVSKALLNYVEMKKYAQKLLKSQEVCK